MADPLTTLEQDLTVLAAVSGGTATPTAALTAGQEVLALLADPGVVGSTIAPAVAAIYTAISTAIDTDVVAALKAIATELGTLTVDAGDAASALTALQGALQTATTLIPGGSSAVASAFASTAQFATLFGNLLQDAGSLSAAAGKLNDIAQQLTTIAAAFTTAAAGSP